MSKFFPLLAICFFSLLMFVSLNVQTASAGSTVMIGGLAEGNKKVPWCCSAFADVCEPCDNPANQHAYKSPSPCSGQVIYQDLAVRCMDDTCNNLTKGEYIVQLCKQDDDKFSTPSTCVGSCKIEPGTPSCKSTASVSVNLQVPIYLQILPGEGSDAPNAPFDGTWSALGIGCDGSG